MRTNVVIDDALMRDAKRAAGCRTKKETIESALKMLIRVRNQGAIRKYRGRLKWEGDLDAMRRD